MKILNNWTLLFILATICLSGQTADTAEIKIRGPHSYFIDGFKVYQKLSKNDSLLILRAHAKDLNGYWKSKKTSDMAKIYTSTKTLSGQLIIPFEEVQQTSPISIKVAFNKFGQVCLVTGADSLRFRFNKNELTLEDEVFYRRSK